VEKVFHDGREAPEAQVCGTCSAPSQCSAEHLLAQRSEEIFTKSGLIGEFSERKDIDQGCAILFQSSGGSWAQAWQGLLAVSHA